MPQKAIVRNKPLAKPTQRKNAPQEPKLKNAVVASLAKKQQAVTMRKIENTVASKSGVEAANLNFVKIDKQLVGHLDQANSKKKNKY